MTPDFLHSDSPPSTVSVAPNGQSVSAIREVLLGDQLRMYEQRFSLLDKTVQTEREAMRDAFEERLADMQREFAERFKGLQEALDAERRARAEELKRVSDKIDQVAQRLTEQQQILRNDHQTAKQDSQREMLSLSKNLFRELQESTAKLRKLIDHEAEELRHVKMDRQELAAAFSNMASHCGLEPTSEVDLTREASTVSPS